MVRDTQLAPRGPHAQKPERLAFFPFDSLHAFNYTANFLLQPPTHNPLRYRLLHHWKKDRRGTNG